MVVLKDDIMKKQFVVVGTFIIVLIVELSGCWSLMPQHHNAKRKEAKFGIIL